MAVTDGEKLEAVLREFDVPKFCGTPLCSGSHGLEFEDLGDGPVAYTACPCGCEADYVPLSSADVIHLLRRGWDAQMNLEAVMKGRGF